MSSTREIRDEVSPLVEFRRLKHVRGLTPDIATLLASEAADTFLERHNAPGHGLRDAVTLLCELASLADPVLARIGVRGIFPMLVEPLGDAFTPEACALYNRLFVQVIQYCRRRPEGVAIDRRLQH